MSAALSLPRAVAVVPILVTPTAYITAPHVFRTWGPAALHLLQPPSNPPSSQRFALLLA